MNEEADDLGIIGASNPTNPPIIHSKTDVHQIPDQVEEDLNDQSAEEIQFNNGGANAIDEDVINAQAPGDDDFQWPPILMWLIVVSTLI